MTQATPDWLGRTSKQDKRQPVCTVVSEAGTIHPASGEGTGLENGSREGQAGGPWA